MLRCFLTFYASNLRSEEVTDRKHFSYGILKLCKPLENLSTRSSWWPGGPANRDKDEMRSKVQLGWRRHKLVHVSYHMLLLTAGRMAEQAPVDARRLSPVGILENVVSCGLGEMLQFNFMDQKGAQRREKISISLPGSFVTVLQWFPGRENDDTDQGTCKLGVRGVSSPPTPRLSPPLHLPLSAAAGPQQPRRKESPRPLIWWLTRGISREPQILVSSWQWKCSGK